MHIYFNIYTTINRSMMLYNIQINYSAYLHVNISFGHNIGPSELASSKVKGF